MVRSGIVIIGVIFIGFAIAGARFGIYSQDEDTEPRNRSNRGAVEAPTLTTNQELLKEQFLKEDIEAQIRILQITKKIEPENIKPELREAMMRVLVRSGQTVTDRTEAVVRGEDAEVFGDPSSLIFRLIPAVWALQDPAFIPALTPVLEFQPASYEALASFGEQAVPSLINVAMSPNSRPGQIRGALIALRFIVEAAVSDGSLTQESRNEITRVARRYLTEKDQDVSGMLRHAIDLAIALNDPSLRNIVESFARDENALISRGVENPRRRQQMQRQAEDRLSGIPSDLKPQGIEHYRYDLP